MERRNLDFDLEMSPEEWDTLRLSVDALGSEEAGFGVGPEGDETIQVIMTERDQPAGWQDWIGNDQTYGATEREVARFYYNFGSPFATIEVGDRVQEPTYSEEEISDMQVELERWVRGKWHELLRESGIRYER